MAFDEIFGNSLQRYKSMVLWSWYTFSLKKCPVLYLKLLSGQNETLDHCFKLRKFTLYSDISASWFLEGNFYDSSHEIFEVFNHEGIPFIESVDYGKRETQQRETGLQQDQMMSSWPWLSICGEFFKNGVLVFMKLQFQSDLNLKCIFSRQSRFLLHYSNNSH